MDRVMFDKTMLLEEKGAPTWQRRCIECEPATLKVLSQKVRENNGHKLWCRWCKKYLPHSDFAAPNLKRTGQDRHTCKACDDEHLFPPCSKCGKKPEKRLRYDVNKRYGQYICDPCRYPPCETPGCNAPRPKSGKTDVTAIPQWWCPSCRPSKDEHLFPPCSRCGKKPEKQLRYDVEKRHGQYICDPCRYPPCETPGCNAPRPKGGTTDVTAIPQWWCPSCRSSRCACCNEPRVTGGRPSQGPWYCENCQKCDQCDKWKRKTEFAIRANRIASSTCPECEHPTCTACGAKATGRAIRRDAKLRVGDALVWYCATQKCQAEKQALKKRSAT